MSVKIAMIIIIVSAVSRVVLWIFEKTQKNKEHNDDADNG